MRRALTAFVLLLLAVAVAMPLVADGQEGARKGKNKRKQQQGPAAQFKKQLAEVDLTEAQQTQIDEIVAKHSPGIEAAQQKVSQLLTADQRRARNAAMKKAREAGKKGKQLRADVDAALQLTAEQKASLDKAEQEARDAQQKLRQEVAAVLTPEQREKAGLQRDRGGAKKAKKSKKKDA